MINKILWSDETKIELFSVAGTGRLVRVEGKMNGAKYREIQDENLHQSAQAHRQGRRFTFQPDNDPMHTANKT